MPARQILRHENKLHQIFFSRSWLLIKNVQWTSEKTSLLIPWELRNLHSIWKCKQRDNSGLHTLHQSFGYTAEVDVRLTLTMCVSRLHVQKSPL